MKTRFGLAACILAALAALPQPARAAEKPRKIVAKLADILSPEHPHTRTWQFFAERVREKTGGRVEVQVYHSGQLGQTKDLYQAVQMGSIEMAKMPFSFAGEWVPEAKVFDLPYLFADRDELWRVLRGPVGARFQQEIFPKQGMLGLLWVDDGCRSIYASRPVRRPEDLKGLKIRVQPSDVQLQAINAMGAIATPLAFGEVYLALQQKVLDGAENSPALYYTSKHWEVSKVFSLTEQFWSVHLLLVNQRWWGKLPGDVQAAFREAAREAESYFLEIYAADEKTALDRLQEKGVQVVTDVDREAFRARTEPVYEAFVRKHGRELLDQVRAAKTAPAAQP